MSLQRNAMLFSILVGAGLLAPGAQAQVPYLLTYDGYLELANGTPVTTAQSMTFELWDAASGGNKVWFEDYFPLPANRFTDGHFTVELGTNTPLTDAVLDGTPLWLEVFVNYGSLGRTPLAYNMPYAIRAAVCDAVNGDGPITLLGSPAPSVSNAGSGAMYFDSTANAFMVSENGGSYRRMNVVPTGAIVMFAGACPEGWLEYTAARGRLLLGVPADGTVESTKGTPITGTAGIDHTHGYTPAGTVSSSFTGTNANTANAHDTANGPGYDAPVAITAGGAAVNLWGHVHNYTPAGSVSSSFTGSAGTSAASSANPPTLQLRLCKAP